MDNSECEDGAKNCKGTLNMNEITEKMTPEQAKLASKHDTPVGFRAALLYAAWKGSITTEEMVRAAVKYQEEWDQAGGAFPETEEQSAHQLRVEAFMRLAKQALPGKPTIPDPKVRELRARLILEEALEAAEALGCDVWVGDQIKQYHANPAAMKSGTIRIEASSHKPDFAEIVKECCDIAVVTTGTLSAFGVKDKIPHQIVDDNNLAKFGPGHSIRADGKLVKPPNHKKPDMQGEIDRQSGL